MPRTVTIFSHLSGRNFIKMGYDSIGLWQSRQCFIATLRIASLLSLLIYTSFYFVFAVFLVPSSCLLFYFPVFCLPIFVPFLYIMAVSKCSSSWLNSPTNNSRRARSQLSRWWNTFTSCAIHLPKPAVSSESIFACWYKYSLDTKTFFSLKIHTTNYIGWYLVWKGWWTNAHGKWFWRRALGL